MKFTRSGGLSLVELLVALMLGSMIAAAGIQLLLTTSKSYRLQNGMTDVQESGRFAIEYMTRDIRMAGYGMAGAEGSGKCLSTVFNALNSNPSAIRFGADESKNDETVIVTDANGGQLYTFVSDELVIHRCAVSALDTNCLGSNTNITEETLIITRYYVRDRNLFCKDETVDRNGPVGMIASGVDNFQVQYGVLTEGNDFFISSYLNADQVFANVDSTIRVGAIKIGLLLSGDKNVNATDSVTTSTFVILDSGDVVVGNDGDRINRKFTTTVELRNVPKKLKLNI